MGAMPFHWLQQEQASGFGQREGKCDQPAGGHMAEWNAADWCSLGVPSRADDIQTRESCVPAVYGSHKQDFRHCSCCRQLVYPVEQYQ